MSSDASTTVSQPADTRQIFRREQRTLLIQMVLLAVFVLVMGQMTVSWISLIGFEQELDPQLQRKANAVGNSLSGQLAYATRDLEIPVADLVGVEEFFDNILAANDDLAYLTLVDSKGTVLFVSSANPGDMEDVLQDMPAEGVSGSHSTTVMNEHTDVAFPVAGGSQPDSTLHVGIHSDQLRNHLIEVFWEVITVIVICWLVTFEFLLFLIVARVEKPIELIQRAMADGADGRFANWLVVRSNDEVGQLTASFNRTLQHLRHRYNDFLFDARETKDAQIDTQIAAQISAVRQGIDNRFRFQRGDELQSRTPARIRVPLFLFIFSEELSRSFLPLFVQRYAPTDLMISSDVLIGLPITLFMVAAMIATPIGGGFVDRVGVRWVFLVGIFAAVVGFVGNFLTQGYYDLVIYRVVTGIGYGLVFIASEGWVTQNAQRYNRASSTGVFVAAVFAGIICGPPIGGIFADRFGFEATFLISAMLAIVSGFIIFQVFRESEGSQQSAANQSSLKLMIGVRDWITLLKDPKFVSVLMFAAIPGKMMVAGFIAYLVPLYLNDLGHGQPAIGRILMIYGVATLLCLTLPARFADRTERYRQMVVLGATIAGAGCIAALLTNYHGNASFAVVLAIGSLGVGHALTLTSQNSIIQQVAERYRDTLGRASVVGAYRLCERIGMVIGPLVAVALITAFGYQGAIVGFGVILLGLIGLFVLTDRSAAGRTG